jgi:hypothetical protein
MGIDRIRESVLLSISGPWEGNEMSESFIAEAEQPLVLRVMETLQQ